MAVKFKFPGMQIFSRLDARSRIFFLIGVVLGFGFLIYFIVSYFSGGENTTGPSRVAGAPTSLKSIPGEATNPEYERAIQQYNERMAAQAKISGTSSIPILTNVQGQTTGAGPCNIICPDEAANVKYDLDDWVAQGKIAPDLADQLKQLANSNVSVDEYAAMLDRLVKEGKLTPEQARQLLARYRKQHADALLQDSAKTMDAFIKAGQLPVDAATDLLALQKMGVSPEDYSAELDRLVREGKISPAVAQQLLAQYNQQRGQELAKQASAQLKQMQQNGEITADVARDLGDLQSRNVPLDQYEAELNRLVAAGKLTPAAAAKLRAAYQKQKSSLGPGGVLNQIVKQAENAALNNIDNLTNSGQLTQDVASALKDAIKNNMSPEDYEAMLNRLVKEGKISPELAKQLLADYKRQKALKDQAARLAALQGNNASAASYNDELKRAVQAGLLTPGQAAALAQEYQALKVIPSLPAGTTPLGPEASEFAKLQQRVQQQATITGTPATAPVTATQFTEVAKEVTTESEQDRLQRLQALMGAMSSQAGQLISAWAAPTMEHKEGAPPPVATEGGTTTGTFGPNGTNTTGTTGTQAQARSLIKAGTILFGVLDTAVNSDYPDTPVMVTIVEGPLKGAKLLGKLQVAQSVAGQLDRVALNFNLMNFEPWPASRTVNAFAIDPDTARTVLASNVDYHYLKRYGAIMATSFLTGYSNAIMSSGATGTTGIFGTSTQNPKLSAGSKLAVGFGQIGTSLGNVVQNYVSIPPTVKVDSGVGLGILFMTDVPQ